MDYKLIAIDMDGTLLNSQNEITERNKKAILKATELGIKVVLSTGRIFTSALYYAKSLEINTPIISCNGAYVTDVDKKSIIYENPIPIEYCKKLINLAEEKDIYYHFYDDTTFYVRELDKTVMKNYRWNEDRDDVDVLKIEVMDKPLEFIEKRNPKVYKFVFIDDDIDKLINFRKIVSEIEKIEVVSSWWNNIEIMNRGVSKGVALSELCKKMDINIDQVIAIGDNENDISMLKAAGLGVAMGNGEEEVRIAADIVTDTNDESGVGKVIEKYILKSNN